MLLKKQLTTAKVCSECRDCCGFYAFAPIVSEEQKNAIVKEKKVSGKNFKRLKDGSWQIVLKPGKVHDYCPFFINEM
ncbi:hypothetical protein KY316_01100 [Candidatus Woesearchaeota archaeon]|nr:hypothetical protein [Candidatus Woesearchaeota archaeon]